MNAPTAHLTPERWRLANRLLVRKALAEFAHERLLAPAPDGAGFLVRGDDGLVEYRFTATRHALDTWSIDPDSILRQRAGTELPVDALDFFLDLRHTLGLTDEVLPVYLEEITATLSSTAWKLAHRAGCARDLAGADFQAIESGMTEGHPGFVANNGRIGYGVDDYHRYAPEVAAPVRLVWLAAHRDHARFTCSADTTYDRHVLAELGPAALAEFAATMADLTLDLNDYLLLPVHPWQWWNKLSVTFAGEVATRRLVFLGRGPDEYVAQQSIRTFFNVSQPDRHYVKTAVSVLNMGFMRGLSAAYMEATPAINDWLAELLDGDEVFRATGLRILRERAAVGYRHRQLEAATDRYSPYRKMLAALWRESPVAGLRPTERLTTMAALLHVDQQGHSLAAALIERSGRTPEDWVRRFLDACLTPLLHAFYAHDLAFMPHGENVILVLEDDTVTRAIFKDIAEEIVVMDPARPLPPAVERIRADVPEDMRLLSIFTDVVDGFLRYLAVILAERGVLAEGDFWRTVAGCARAYQDGNPHLAERFARYDLFASEFALSCLNRLQLRDNRQMVDLADPTAALQLIGTLRNPLAA